MAYQSVLEDGRILETEETFPTLGIRELISVVEEALSLGGRVCNVIQEGDSSEVFSFTLDSDIDEYSIQDEIKYYFVMKNSTPGGREQLKNEQRIQVKGDSINFVFDKFEGKYAFLLGIYKGLNSEPIFITWKSVESGAAGTSSKQIKVETISKAYKFGFSQQLRGKEYACAFRKELFYFYLQNLDWIHDYKVEHLNEIERQTINSNFKNEYIQKIFFGPPGCGKSYKADQLMKDVPDEFIFSTTVYPDYDYYNFIGSIMPVVRTKNGEKQITYDFNPGVFTLALSKALEHRDKNIFLKVEEMSRGNIAAIFGDIFQLLDRDKDGNSEYKISHPTIIDYFNKNNIAKEDPIINLEEKIYIPSNLNIIGTVNTSDQNVFAMDTAFKRRFDFEYVDIKPIEEKNIFKFKLSDELFSWNKFYPQLNKYIVEDLHLSEDKQLGQFFINFEKYSTEESKYTQIYNKLLLYLWEDVHMASLEESSLFTRNGVKCKTFSEAFEQLKNHKNIFNEKIKPDCEIDSGTEQEFDDNSISEDV